MVLPQVCPDTASFAATYESISLRLDKLTPEQSRVSLCTNSVYLYLRSIHTAARILAAILHGCRC